MSVGQQVTLFVKVPNAEEVSDIATSLFRARIAAHPGANSWPEDGLTYLKRSCVKDATAVWEYLEKRGWRRCADAVSPGEVLK